MMDERKLLLLGLLRQKDMHGYLLYAHLGAAMPITLKKPTAYHLLEVMEKDGWIRYREERSGKRTRRVYALTRTGEAAFADLLRRQLAAFTPPECPGLVSLGFLDALPAGDVRELLETRRTKMRETMAGFHRDPGEPDPHHPGSLDPALRYYLRTLALELDFLEEVIRNLEDK